MKPNPTPADFVLALEQMGAETLELGLMKTYQDEFAILIHHGLIEALRNQEVTDALAKIITLESGRFHSGYMCLQMALASVLDKTERPWRNYRRVISALREAKRVDQKIIDVIRGLENMSTSAPLEQQQGSFAHGLPS